MKALAAPHAGVHPMKRQCTATRRDGARCTRAPILGGTVCRMHGGAAPQVRAKAQERLKALVDPAITALSEIVADTKHPQRLGAVREVLERYGRIGAEKSDVLDADGGLITYEQLEIIIRKRRAAVEPGGADAASD